MKIDLAWGLCGSFCTIEKTLACMREVAAGGARIRPVLSYHAARLDTRFGTAQQLYKDLKEITGNEPIDSLQGAEPIGPKHLAQAVVLAPCTGNTMAKLAAGIIDSPVLMAAKSHLRNGGPVIIALSTNDGLSGSAQNIGKLLNTKNIYFVPFLQDDWEKKPTSLQADFERLPAAIEAALEGRQLQPLLRGAKP
ncbi:MAG: dipicolinate synthase subunit B [Oscillospiraceae bacterium]|nr:dipicolinate synthase subunit B [Oscillospiraceae bacterium]